MTSIETTACAVPNGNVTASSLDQSSKPGAAAAALDHLLEDGTVEDNEDAIEEEDDDEEEKDDDDASSAGTEMTPTKVDIAPTPAGVPAAAFVGRRPPSVVRRENKMFVVAHFDRTERADDRNGGCSRCKVCGRSVQLGTNPIRSLLRHAVTSTCLLRRVALGTGAPRDISSDARCVKALSHFTGRHPGVIEAFRSVWGTYYVGASEDADGSRATTSRWMCRNCTAQVFGCNQSQQLFQHVIWCIGVVPLLQSLTAALREFAASSSTCVALSYLDEKSTGRPETSATRLHVPAQDSEEGNVAIAPSQSASTTLPGDVNKTRNMPVHPTATSTECSSVIGCPPSSGIDTKDGPGERHAIETEEAAMDDIGSDKDVLPAVDGLAPQLAPAGASGSRLKKDIFTENREFVEANFEATELKGGSTCKICAAKVVYQNKAKVSQLLRHALTSSCLLWRVQMHAAQLGLPLVPIATNSPLLTGVFQTVWRSHFSTPGGGTAEAEAEAASLLVPWSCRHCSTTILGHGNNRRFFVHLLGCVGIVPLLRALEASLRERKCLDA